MKFLKQIANKTKSLLKSLILNEGYLQSYEDQKLPLSLRLEPQLQAYRWIL